MAKSIFIEGREWFDKSAGNTYWSSRVWVDGAVAFQIPISYGRDNMYFDASLVELADRGYIPPTDRLPDLRAAGIVVYRSLSQVLKREMFRDWKPETN